MRIAVLSDIHANLEALQEVLADIDRSRVDEVICLGDAVGYGPQPEEVLALLRRRRVPMVMGNHELALAADHYLQKLNSTARQSLLHTLPQLSATSLGEITALPPVLCRHGIRFVHGAPPDSVNSYLFSPPASRLRQVFASFGEELCFFGHTHLPALYRLSSGGEPEELEPTDARPFDLEKGERWLVNVGSVGQPRDRLNNRAKYGIWDGQRQRFEFRFVSYDIEAVAAKIRALGLPETNARRLY